MLDSRALTFSAPRFISYVHTSAPDYDKRFHSLQAMTEGSPDKIRRFPRRSAGSMARADSARCLFVKFGDALTRLLFYLSLSLNILQGLPAVSVSPRRS